MKPKKHNEWLCVSCRTSFVVSQGQHEIRCPKCGTTVDQTRVRPKQKDILIGDELDDLEPSDPVLPKTGQTRAEASAQQDAMDLLDDESLFEAPARSGEATEFQPQGTSGLSDLEKLEPSNMDSVVPVFEGVHDAHLQSLEALEDDESDIPTNARPKPKTPSPPPEAKPPDQPPEETTSEEHLHHGVTVGPSKQRHPSRVQPTWQVLAQSPGLRTTKRILRAFGPTMAACAVFLAWVAVRYAVDYRARQPQPKPPQAVLSQFDRLLGEAIIAYRDGDTETGIRHVDEALQIQPKSQVATELRRWMMEEGE